MLKLLSLALLLMLPLQAQEVPPAEELARAPSTARINALVDQAAGQGHPLPKLAGITG